MKNLKIAMFGLAAIGLMILAIAITDGLWPPKASAQFQNLGFPVSNPLASSTTLSGSIQTTTINVCLASATNVIVPALATGVVGSALFIDREMMLVTNSGSSSTCFRVTRGRNGTPTQQHFNGSIVWIGQPATSSGDTSRPFSLNLFPLEDASPQPLNGPQPVFGGPASSSAAPVSGSIYLSEISVEHSRPITGLCMLNGGTVGTDNHIFVLYDYFGNLLGQTAATLAAGTNQYQCQPLVTPIEISALRSFFVGFQSNGTTALVQKYVTGQLGLSEQAGSLTGVSGTIPATIAIPTTFTTATGPIGALY
jgi:hypothetical protein